MNTRVRLAIRLARYSVKNLGQSPRVHGAFQTSSGSVVTLAPAWTNGIRPDAHGLFVYEQRAESDQSRLCRNKLLNPGSQS